MDIPQDELEEQQKLTKTQRRLRAAQDRATRLKQLRPDIEKIGDRVTVEEALALGGYKTTGKMDMNLAKRARKLSL